MRMLVLSCSLVSSVATAGPWALLTPGQHHGGSVKKVGSGWLGLFAERLGPVKLKLDRVRDPIDDEDKPEAVMTGVTVSVEGSEQPSLLLKGVKAGAITRRDLTGKPSLSSGEPIALDGATLSTTQSGTRSELVLTQGSVQQVLYSQAEGDRDGWELVFAGDLDSDGKLDLILSADHHYNLSTLRLFLSSAARTGQLVKQVTTFGTQGC